ncbi:MAG: hypothetical protein V3V75_00265 [Thermoguttaceae bacterium]
MRKIVAAVVLVVAGSYSVEASQPVALRVESLMVPPSTQTMIFVQVKNLRDKPYETSLSLKVPEKWRIAPAVRNISLQPNEIKRVPFTIEWGVDVKANSYPIEVTAQNGPEKVVRRQNVVVASAPYFKPTIDGIVDEWADALAVTFTSGGKRSVISTYWNRRALSILIAVEEDDLLPYKGEGPFDAVQVAISPQDTKTGTTIDEEATRFEFLFVSSGTGTEGTCFKLATPGMKLAEAAKRRDLAPLAYEDAKVAVTRSDGITYYECSIPFKLMRGAIRPSEGRELFLSVLVHDVNGTGVRDWGEAAGLWLSQRNRLAWSDFKGAKWGEKIPFDNKLCWGLCTSKY